MNKKMNKKEQIIQDDIELDIDINDVTTKVNEVNQNFYNASLKARRNYSQNLRNANVSQALKNLAEIHAYKSSIIPYGDYSNKYLSLA